MYAAVFVFVSFVLVFLVVSAGCELDQLAKEALGVAKRGTLDRNQKTGKIEERRVLHHSDSRSVFNCIHPSLLCFSLICVSGFGSLSLPISCFRWKSRRCLLGCLVFDCGGDTNVCGWSWFVKTEVFSMYEKDDD